jgi:hypothetical protein
VTNVHAAQGSLCSFIPNNSIVLHLNPLLGHMSSIFSSSHSFGPRWNAHDPAVTLCLQSLMQLLQHIIIDSLFGKFIQVAVRGSLSPLFNRKRVSQLKFRRSSAYKARKEQRANNASLPLNNDCSNEESKSKNV